MWKTQTPWYFLCTALAALSIFVAMLADTFVKKTVPHACEDTIQPFKHEDVPKNGYASCGKGRHLTYVGDGTGNSFIVCTCDGNPGVYVPKNGTQEPDFQPETPDDSVYL